MRNALIKAIVFNFVFNQHLIPLQIFSFVNSLVLIINMISAHLKKSVPQDS